jgi:CheY-like chemotaxis protein
MTRANQNEPRDTVSDNDTPAHSSAPAFSARSERHPVSSDGRISKRESSLRRTVLICEDDEGIRELLVDALQAEGFAVDEARNGREALELLRREDSRYLVLLDLMMPDISGYDILERMNADPQLLGEHIVVVVSATGFIRPVSPGIIEKRLVKGFLKKPFELDELIAMVYRWA